MRKGGIIIKLREMLENETARLLAIREKVERNLNDVPQGRLRVVVNKGYVQYYYNRGGEDGEIYLSKKNVELARKLAQKTYDEKILRCVEKRIKQFNRILKDYENDEIDQLYLRECVVRRKLIEPVVLTFEQKLDVWMSDEYSGKGFHEELPVILTNNGLRVRSKSEKIMADYFDSIGIKYKYECPLKLNDYGVVYPDFTFLSPRTGEEIYWEHEGMMDKPDYARNAVQKIEMYERNKIFPGENLILSFETSVTAINMNNIKRLTKKYLMQEN